jgi:DNA primase
MAGIISDDVKEQIRAASPIVDVISSYLGPLKKAGGSFVALCPFHNEKTPSFHVNPTRQSFHCFGCNEGGDVFTFVKLYESLTFPEAIRRLAERARIPLEFENDPEAGRKRQLRETLFEIHEKITQHWQTALLNDAAGQVARDYLARRGVSAEAVERFRLGYAPNEWEDAVNWAQANRYDPDIVARGGIIIKRDQGEGYYDRFRGRLIFPIADDQGRVVAFSGRILNDEEKTAKYVNSPETPLFTKGRIIYGLDKARRPIADAGFSIVCEGQLDLIRCHISGIENVVAPQGTALTGDHGRILKRYADEVVLCFDSDSAGQKAAVRSLEALAPVGLSIRVLNLPPPHDPDSYIREMGAEALKEAVKQAPEYFEFLLNRLCEQTDPQSDRGRRAILLEMNTALNTANDAVLRDTWTRKLAARFGVGADAVMLEMRKLNRNPRRPGPEREPEYSDPDPVVEEEEIPDQELWLLKLFFMVAAKSPETLAQTNVEWLSSPTVRGIVAIHLGALQENAWDGQAPLFDQLDRETDRRTLAGVLAEVREIPQPAGQYSDILRRLRDQSINGRIGRVSQRLKDPGTPEEELPGLVTEMNDLKRQKQTPLT